MMTYGCGTQGGEAAESCVRTPAGGLYLGIGYLQDAVSTMRV